MALWVLTAAAAAAPAGAVGGEVRLLAEVLDAKGRVPEGLVPQDLEVTEGGAAVVLAGLKPWAPRASPARVVIYFDRELSSKGALRRAASALGEEVRQLTGLGEVEIVAAGAVAESELRSRDALVVGEKLSRMALADSGEGRVLGLRQRVLKDLRPGAPVSVALAADEAAGVVAAGIEEELELVRERSRQLLAWASEVPRKGGAPGLLVLVADGFDLDPVGFYLRFLDDAATRALLRRLPSLLTLEGPVSEAGRTLAALGWTVLPVSIGPPADETAGLEYAPLSIGGEARGTTSAPGVTLRPGSLFGRRGDRAGEEPEAPRAAFVDPLAPWKLLAGATGGEVAATEAGLRDALGRFAGRFELRYPSRLPLGADATALEVRALRPGWTVRARSWHASGVPRQVAAVRAERLLAGVESAGGFDVAAVLRLDRPPEPGEGAPARLEARLALADLEVAVPGDEPSALDSAVFRVTLAIAAAGSGPQLRHEVIRAENLAQLEEWHYRTELELPAGASEVAVLVEDLAGDGWGGRRATVLEGDWADAAGQALPAPTVVEIQQPGDGLLRGRVKFEAEVYDSRVALVDFLLDDREVASKREPPFAARLDLGRTPRRRTLTVVAYDAADVELGRDSVVLNGGGAGLAVEIVRPSQRRGTGWVEVEAEVSVPVERRLDRVLFFWNNEQAATLYGSPFRQRIYIPEDRPVGYVRVVALLDDGTLAEDVAFMNGPAHGERLEVNLVELYVVVTDATGRPVRGLAQEEFRVREDGVPQDIAAFSDASDLPLTLGMAIDSSASMFVKLPTVQDAAIGFLRSTFSEQDRAFVVDFDSEPRLARSTTGSLDRIVRSISALEASGRTALWESIVFSLVQLQGVRGRKALIVFSDGADEDDQFPFRSSLSVAKKMGVPIYLILMRKQPKNDSGLSLLTRSFTSRVNRLVEATGGRVFYAKEFRDLSTVYDEIEQELRSQYLLAYYPREPSRGESWREVEVDVARRGLKPRTLKGYWD